MSYVFGPVPSRRLGRSLGVDLVPFKTCTYDCVYCQLGRTTCKTIDRAEWAPLDDVVAELEGRLSSRPDYVTLSGSGEPTLFLRLEELIDRIKRMTDVPVAVLTNGSLLWQAEVRRGLGRADLLLPSLDAGCERTFQRVNRPHESLSFEQVLEGLIACRRGFRGQFWLEVLVLAGVTDGAEELARIAACVDRIGPDRTQLNTVMRPPTDQSATGVPAQRLAELAGMFPGQVDVIARTSGAPEHAEFSVEAQEVLVMLKRRPCSMADIAAGLGVHVNHVAKHLEHLMGQGLVECVRHDTQAYYRAVSPEHGS